MYEKMSVKEKNWYSVKSGFFVLLSNDKKDPKVLLDEYFSRTQIENVFKTAKEYLQILPLNKWTFETVSGKLLSDCISTIIYLLLQKKLDKSKLATTRLFGQVQSLMCLKTHDGIIHVETANKQVRNAYKAVGILLPTTFKLSDFCDKTLKLESAET